MKAPAKQKGRPWRRGPPFSLRLTRGAVIDHVRTSDGLTLAGLESAGRADRPILLVHGHGSSGDDSARWMAPLLADGWGIVAAEYRGYSGNPGHAGEAGLAREADAFLARATALAVGDRRRA